MKSGNLNFLEPSGPLQACNGTALLLDGFIIRICHDTRTRERKGHAGINKSTNQQAERETRLKKELL